MEMTTPSRQTSHRLSSARAHFSHNQDIKAFGRKLSPLVGPGNMSYTQGVVLHIWHGDRANRDYTHRYQILLSNRYDPVSDVRVNEAGVLVWSSEKARLHNQVSGHRPGQNRMRTEQKLSQNCAESNHRNQTLTNGDHMTNR